MKTRPATDRQRYRTLGSAELREAFLVEDLFEEGELHTTYFENERAVVGGAMPAGTDLELTGGAELAAEHFCQRRELGVLNLGGEGTVQVDDATFVMGELDCLYVGRGRQRIVFRSHGSAPAPRFYLLSFPAHTEHPTALIPRGSAETERLGSADDANVRTIHKCIHPGGVKSCQLVMGYTTLEKGSVWDTMPPHTHARRSEIYMYFGLGAREFVVHLMGTPDETRHLIVRDGQAVMSPMWSIHTGAGTAAYTFCWGMGGENQEFADMDGVGADELR